MSEDLSWKGLKIIVSNDLGFKTNNSVISINKHWLYRISNSTETLIDQQAAGSSSQTGKMLYNMCYR